jgi:hypothetical protein
MQAMPENFRPPDVIRLIFAIEDVHSGLSQFFKTSDEESFFAYLAYVADFPRPIEMKPSIIVPFAICPSYRPQVRRIISASLRIR